MQHHGGRIHVEGAVGHDPGIEPSLSLFIVHQEHVVGKNPAKSKGALILGLRLGGGGLRQLNLLHGNRFLSIFLRGIIHDFRRSGYVFSAYSGRNAERDRPGSL